MMKKYNFKKISNKKIAILGLGVENYYLLKFFLRENIPSNFCVFDDRTKEAIGERYLDLADEKNITWKLGRYHGEDFLNFDIIFRSPGFPLFTPALKKAAAAGVEISSPMNAFFELCPTGNIIGVTGTKGKGTTSSLIFNILKEDERSVFLGGNIGTAPFEFIEKLNGDSWVVLELSSFQLEDLRYSPRISVITNLYKEHLAPADPNNPNYHKSLDDYWQAKANIFNYQKNNSYLIVNKSLEDKIARDKNNSKVIFFGKSNLPSRLIGDHNQENIAAALEVAKILKIRKEIYAKAVADFSGLPHRLELVAQKDGVSFYDDSFATTPEATITAIRSFNCPIIIILGGADKGSTFKDLAKEIIKKKIKFIIFFEGEATPRIKKELSRIDYPVSKQATVSSMKSALSEAILKAEPGDVVLLSTACASFGIFKNYKERGDLFKEAVKKIAK